jgi:hypothetical protein
MKASRVVFFIDEVPTWYREEQKFVEKPIDGRSDVEEYNPRAVFTGDGICEEGNHCINNDHVCIICKTFVETGGQTNYVSEIKKRKMSDTMFELFEKMELSRDVRAAALYIHNSLKISITRGIKFKRLTFFCVYRGYHMVGIPISPHILGSKIGLCRKDIQQSTKIASFNITNSIFPKINITAMDLIPQTCALLKFSDDDIQRINQIAFIVTRRDKELRDEENAQKTLSGIVRFYSKICGYKLDKQMFNTIVGLSEATITKMVIRINAVYNS